MADIVLICSDPFRRKEMSETLIRAGHEVEMRMSPMRLRSAPPVRKPALYVLHVLGATRSELGMIEAMREWAGLKSAPFAVVPEFGELSRGRVSAPPGVWVCSRTELAALASLLTGGAADAPADSGVRYRGDNAGQGAVGR